MKKYITPVRVFVAISIGCVVAFLYALGAFDKDYSLTELKENFNTKQAEIYELKSYFNSITPENKHIEIAFNGNRSLQRFVIRELDSVGNYKQEPLFSKWDLNINSSITDSAISTLGWTKENLKTLKEKLDNANCIGIENSWGNVGNASTKIEFQRCGPCMYSFVVFDKPIPDNLKKDYNDSCTYIMVNDRLVLEYGSGVYGKQCFYNMK